MFGYHRSAVFNGLRGRRTNGWIRSRLGLSGEKCNIKICFKKVPLGLTSTIDYVYAVSLVL